MKHFLLAALLALPGAGLWAGDGHGHDHEAASEPAPHGGVLRDVMNAKGEVVCKAEAVLKGDVVKIYVYGKDLKPLALDAKKLEGDVQFPKKKSKPVAFHLKKDLFEAKIAGIGKVHRYDMHVYITLNGEKLKADFGIDNVH